MDNAAPPPPDTESMDDREALRTRLEWFAKWSDDVYRVPFTQTRIGLEPLLGVLPGVGDAAGLLVAAYVPVEAWRQDAPWPLIRTMLKTIAIDALVGTVPVLGDVFDVTYRANRRNANRLIEWLEAQDDAASDPEAASAPPMDVPEPRTEPQEEPQKEPRTETPDP